MLDSTLPAAARRETQLLGLAAAFVVTAALALATAPFARAGTWAAPPLGPGGAPVTAGAGALVFALAWALCAGAAVYLVRRRLPNHDPYLLPVVYLLAGWGLALITRLTPVFGLRQTAWLGVATAGMLGVVWLPGDLRWLRRYRYTWLLAGLALTALTLVFGVNPSGEGVRLWLGCCGLYLQPAEILKLLLVVFLASYLAERRDMLFNTTTASAAPRRARLAYFLPMLAMWSFSTLVLVTQRDLGMSTLFFAIFVIMLYLASGEAAYVALGAALLGAAAMLGYGLFDVVRLRVEAWWNPWADPSGRSFQIVQSLIAIAAGGVVGRGPGLGAPGLVPVAHSDFIFASVAEEWGLLGALAAVGLLLAVVVRGLRIAARAPGPFRQLLAGGLAAALGVQTLLIAGGVVKLIPLTGVTLPFVSYGGSSLVANFLVVGLLLKLSAPAQRGVGG
jgi:cell division protein FtsW (lipid II flippase)